MRICDTGTGHETPLPGAPSFCSFNRGSPSRFHILVTTIYRYSSSGKVLVRLHSAAAFQDASEASAFSAAQRFGGSVGTQAVLACGGCAHLR